MSERSETPASPAFDDDATVEREHLRGDSPGDAGDAGDASRLPPDEAAPAPFTEPWPARVTRRLGSDERASRRSHWSSSVGALVAAALVVTLISFVLIHLAPSRANLGDSPAVTPLLTALTTATTAATTDTATVTGTVTATAASGGSGTPNNSGGVNQPAGPVYASLYSAGASSHNIQADSSPAQSGFAFSTNTCGPTFTVNTTFNIQLQVTASNIEYYVRHSDGTSDGSIAQPLVLTASPPNTPGVMMNDSWTFPYTLATGTPQWLELDILTPAPYTVHVDFTALCTFSPQSPTTAVSPTSYDCAAGGNQTFTFTGTIQASYAAGSHTLTYHWRRYDGSVTPDQTVTFAQGVTALTAQPDTMVINSSIFPTAPVDDLVVTDQAGVARSTVLSPAICFPTATPAVPTATPVG